MQSNWGGGWRSDNLTFFTPPINPDLDIQPTNRYKLTQHPTKPTYISLHRPDGNTISTIEKRRLDKLHDIYNKIPTNPPFEESLVKLIYRQDKQHHPKKILRELLLSKAKNITERQPLLCGGWPIPDKLYDT